MSYGFGKLNDYVDDAAEISESKGWTVPGFDDPERLLGKLMLVDTEVAEAAEAVRKGDLANYREELADICIRVFHLAWQSSREVGSEPHQIVRWSLEQEIVDKLNKNRKRPYRHGDKRA